ncbi:MAG: sugar transferase [Flavobacteriales bacterium]|nr:sugar transferase [Flavobacteriales bacterium]
MRTNVDSDMKQATKDDRALRASAPFLRKTSLDEFPQFFNVIWVAWAWWGHGRTRCQAQRPIPRYH